MSADGWILAREKLPPAGEWVLVWTGKYHWIAQINSCGMWIPTYENEFWRTPKYWQPLPGKPKGNRK